MSKKIKNVMIAYWCIMEMHPNGSVTRHEVPFEDEKEAQSVAENLPPGIYFVNRFIEIIAPGKLASVKKITKKLNPIKFIGFFIA